MCLIEFSVNYKSLLQTLLFIVPFYSQKKGSERKCANKRVGYFQGDKNFWGFVSLAFRERLDSMKEQFSWN